MAINKIMDIISSYAKLGLIENLKTYFIKIWKSHIDSDINFQPYDWSVPPDSFHSFVEN